MFSYQNGERSDPGRSADRRLRRCGRHVRLLGGPEGHHQRVTSSERLQRFAGAKGTELVY